MDLRFRAYQAKVWFYLWHHWTLVIRFRSAQQTHFMFCAGATYLPRLEEWQVSELEYITTESQHHISDRENGILYSCGWFRISEEFEIEEFLKPGSPLPPAIFASNGLEFPRDLPLVARELP